MRVHGTASGLGRETPARREAGNHEAPDATTGKTSTAAHDLKQRPRRERPNTQSPAPPRGGTATRHPTPSTRGEQACLPPSSTLLDSANHPGGPRPQRRPAAGPGREREATAPARPQAPDGRPAALQEHHQTAERHALTRPRERHAARRRNGPPRRGEGRPGRQQPRGRGGECPLRHKDLGTPPPPRGGKPGSEVGPGSAPLSFPHTTPGRARKGRGARGRSEKSGPIRQECPSLARRGLGPAQESATSPHRSSQARERAHPAPPLPPEEAERRGRGPTGAGRRGTGVQGPQEKHSPRETRKAPGARHAPGSAAPNQGNRDESWAASHSRRRPPEDDRQTACLPPISWYNLPTSGRRKAGHGGGGPFTDRGGLPEGGGGHTPPRRTPSPRENRGGGRQTLHGPSGRPHAPHLKQAPSKRTGAHADGRTPRTRLRPGTDWQRTPGRRPRQNELLA